MTKKFTRIDNGYRISPDWVGFGYFIERCEHYEEHYYAIYNVEECKAEYDSETEQTRYDSFEVKEVKEFDTLKEAKDWCKANARG